MMSRVAFVLGSLLACAYVPAHAEPLAWISLRPAVAASAGTLRLGDVAAITTRELAVLERLLAVPVGVAPSAEAVTHLDRAQLEELLARRGGLAPASIAWSGPSQVAVRRASSRVSGAEIEAAARAALAQWVRARAGEAWIEARSSVSDIEVDAGAPRLVVRPLAETLRASGSQTVWVEIWAEQMFVRAVPVRFDVELARVPGPLRALAVPEPAPRGRVPRPADAPAPVAATPMVVRGQTARLVSVAGAVTVESRVSVLQDGAKGQWVRVRLPAGGAPLDARVVDTGLLEIKQ